MPETWPRTPTLRRHDVAWVKPVKAYGRDLLVCDATLRPLVGDWVARGFPLIVRRQAQNSWAPSDLVDLGLSLPPAAGKQRVAVQAPRDAIDRLSPPPALSDVVSRVATRWQSSLSLLDRLGQEIGVVFRVFGSAAWEALTGIAYLSDRSDLDLLWRPDSRKQFLSGLEIIDRWQRTTGMVADGEIVFADDLAVSCREWNARGRGPRVLVKYTTGVALHARVELLERLPGLSTCADDLRALA